MGAADLDRIEDRAVLVLGNQYDAVLPAADAILQAGGRVVAGLLHDPYVAEVNNEAVEPIGAMLLGHEGRFGFLAGVDGASLIDVWTTPRGPKRILGAADRLVGQRITDVYLGHLIWPGDSVECDALLALVAQRAGELVVIEGSGIAAISTTRWALERGSSRVTVLREPGESGRTRRRPADRPVAAALMSAGWTGPITAADVDRAVTTLRRTGRDPFAGRHWSRRGGSWVFSYVLVCDGGTLTDEAVASLDADYTYGGPDLAAHGVLGHLIAFSDRSGPVCFDVAPQVGPPDVIRLDAGWNDEGEEHPDVAPYGWLEVMSGRLTVVDWHQIGDRSEWHTFDVPKGARIEIHLPATDGVSQSWCYVSLAKPEALIERITCQLTTGMLQSPDFTVTFHADGSAEWQGERLVTPLGEHRADVGRAAFRRLARLIAAEGILDLGPERSYTTCVPILTIDVVRAGTSYTVTRTEHPPEMVRVLKACQRAAARAGWVMQQGKDD